MPGLRLPSQTRPQFRLDLASRKRDSFFMKKVLVTGGAGYKGCVLVPKLLKAGYSVVVYDIMFFGADGLPEHPNLRVIKGDIRDIHAFSAAFAGGHRVIHMACISNDPSFELDPHLSKS